MIPSNFKGIRRFSSGKYIEWLDSLGDGAKNFGHSLTCKPASRIIKGLIKQQVSDVTKSALLINNKCDFQSDNNHKLSRHSRHQPALVSQEHQ